MAKQYKKLQQKIYPKEENEKKTQRKPGKDYLLLGVLIFTIVVTIGGRGSLDNWNRVMYVLLDFSLGLTYLSRHAKLSEVQKVFVDRASFISIGFAVAMFLVVLVKRFTE